jgi:hypothetical protein
MFRGEFPILEQPGHPLLRAQRSKEKPQALNSDPPAQLSASPDGVSPHPRLRLHHAFASRYLPGARDLIVYVPPGYDQQPERAYPILYMHDGQNLFDEHASFVPGRTWRMREHADAAIEAGEVEPLIIVGIHHTGDRRLAEYTPDRDLQMGGGEAASYGLLHPRVDALDRGALPGARGTRSNRARRLVARWSGHALSGAPSCAALRPAGGAFAQRLVEPQKHSWPPERAGAAHTG